MCHCIVFRINPCVVKYHAFIIHRATVYTIPNTYRVQQSLWQSICRIIPGIACTSGSELCSFEPAAPRNTPVEQTITVLAASNTGVPKVGTAKSNDPQSSAASSSTCKKNAAQEVRQTRVPLRIALPRSVWVPKEAFQHIPTVNLVDDRDPPSTRPQKISTPIKATPAADRSHSGKKLDISKIKGAHLLFEMQDRQEKARGRESEAKEQAATSHRVAGESTVPVGNFPPDFRQGYRHFPMELELSPSQRIWPQRPPARARNVLLMLTMRL